MVKRTGLTQTSFEVLQSHRSECNQRCDMPGLGAKAMPDNNAWDLECGVPMDCDCFGVRSF